MSAIASTQLIKFHEQSITVLSHNEKPYVAMKHIVENIGLDWNAQFQRIKRHAVLSKGVVMITTPSNGGNQEYLALPLSMLNGWLFGVDANRVRPEIRDLLIQYQTECFDILFNHFMPKVAAPQIQLATPAQKLQIRRLVEVKAKSIGGGRCDYSIVWRKVQDECKFNKLDELTPAAYQMACKFFNVEPLTGEWEHEQPATIDTPAPMFSSAELHIFTAFLSTFTKIAQKSEVLLEVGQKLDSPILIHLWSQIDHANFMIGSMEKMASKLNAKILMH